jgi:hypothetical protein
MKLSHLALSLSLVLGASAYSIAADASQCGGDPIEVFDVEITVTPERPCLDAAVETPGCRNTAVLTIVNGCSTELSVPRDFSCSPMPETSCLVGPGQETQVFPPVGQQGIVDVTYSMVLDEPLEMHVSYRVEDVVADNEPRADGCAMSSGASPRASAWLVLMALAAISRRARRAVRKCYTTRSRIQHAHRQSVRHT